MVKKETQELIEQVQTADREIARDAVSKGVSDAQEQWIEASLIVEALAHEIINITRTSQTGPKIAAQLRKIAASLEAKPDLH